MLGGGYGAQAARETALVDAVSRGDLTATTQLPEASADPSAKGSSGWPPLLNAIFTNHGELVPALIAAGAGIEVADDDGMTALIWAAYLSRDDVVAELLAAGARVDTRDKYGRTPLHLASERSDLIVVRALLDAGSDVNAQDGSGRTAVMIAAVVTEIQTSRRSFGKARAQVPLITGAEQRSTMRLSEVQQRRRVWHCDSCAGQARHSGNPQVLRIAPN